MNAAAHLPGSFGALEGAASMPSNTAKTSTTKTYTAVRMGAAGAAHSSARVGPAQSGQKRLDEHHATHLHCGRKALMLRIKRSAFGIWASRIATLKVAVSAFVSRSVSDVES